MNAWHSPVVNFGEEADLPKVKNEQIDISDNYLRKYNVG